MISYGRGIFYRTIEDRGIVSPGRFSLERFLFSSHPPCQVLEKDSAFGVLRTSERAFEIARAAFPSVHNRIRAVAKDRVLRSAAMRVVLSEESSHG